LIDSTQFLFGRLDQVAERLRRYDRQFRKYLSIQQDVGFFQAVDETAVCNPVVQSGRLDPDDPEPPEIPLSCSPVPVGILQRPFDRFFGGPVIVASRTPEPFCEFENFCASPTLFYASSYTWHRHSSYGEKEKISSFLHFLSNQQIKQINILGTD